MTPHVVSDLRLCESPQLIGVRSHANGSAGVLGLQSPAQPGCRIVAGRNVPVRREV